MSTLISGFHTPVNLRFGEGCKNEIPSTLKGNNHKKVLVVTDSNLVQAGIPAGIIELLSQTGIKTLVFDRIKENPTEDNVHDGCDALLENKCDAVLAVGGGSSMDAAKAISMLSVHGGKITEYEYGFKPITRKGPSIYLVPTTSGTGSEATFWSVITNQKTHRKYDVGSPFMAAEISFVDPQLTYSLPPSVTAATGMDALCHALESLVTKNSWEATQALALEAVRLVSGNLFAAYSNTRDTEARRKVMLGSMIAGMSFPNAGLGAVHGLTAPLGGHFNVPHGVANAIMLPIIMEYNLENTDELYGRAAQAMGCANATGSEAIRFIKELNEKMDIPDLSSFGIKESDLEKLSIDALGKNSNCESNPVPLDLPGAIELYRKGL